MPPADPLAVPAAHDAPTDRLTSRYDAAARRWHGKISRLRYLDAYAAIARSARERVAPAHSGAPLRVLDAGAGTGGFSLAFAATRTEPLALDLLDRSGAMLAAARANLEQAGLSCRTIVGALGERSLEHGTYDVVLCSHLVEHLPDPTAALADFRAALRPGGALLLVVSKPHWCTALLRLVWGHRALADAEVAERLAAAGLVDHARCPFALGPPSRTSMGHLARRPVEAT
ncbi:class I SAM-dependent methyltransferase [Salinarimonas rosea]|uniref:class I SAM-dependent methyltransferase n=1 Tax=Salinarimonas rosea TaxID=552063 RepID=UPI0003F87C05|nr:class I SAM-dependent methyltransferase [Salinarimonas rosea]